MTVVRFTDRSKVDVIDADCEFRPCYVLGFDKGAFTPGRGYTSYHPGGPRAVCWTRHMSGCPHAGTTLRCWECRTPVEPNGQEAPFGWTCPACGCDRAYRLADVLLDVRPCCDASDVPKSRGERRPYSQRCRSCGTRLTGLRLEVART